TSSNTENKQHSKSFGINFSNDILYQHKFIKKGRTISTNLNTVVNSKANTASLYALNTDRIDTLIATDTLDQKSTLYALSYTIGGNIVYTEPIKKNGQIAINFAPSFTRSTSDKNTNNFDLASDSYSITDSILSNHFINKYITNKIGITYRYNDAKKLSWSIGISGQSALLKNEVIDFTATPVSRHFLSVLPNADLNYKFSKTENLRFFYRTSNNPPSIAQLQNVIDNSNSLILTSGNEMLKQNFSQTIGIRYSRANTAKATNFFLFTNATNTINYIANATTIFSRDTIIQGVKMNAGTQFIQPVNLNGYWNVRTFLTYGFPITKMKSNMNVNAGFVYLRTPTLINLSKNIANAYTLNAGITLSSNISKKIDFTLSYHANYNIVRNSLQRINNANYYNHTATARFNYQFWKGFVFNTSVSNTLNAGGSSNYNTSYWLLNASLAYKFLKDESLEVKFTANDILNQNKNITRNVTEVYVEDIQSTALRRYFMGTITYSLRKLGTGNADADKPKDFMLLPPPSGMPPPPGH
ncbi:MAG TPA: TonB-dependent receptor, partial [Chitinophagales bacterium]|nr:TonB-dependent receptor [Chitinophagales bacterium]